MKIGKNAERIEYFKRKQHSKAQLRNQEKINNGCHSSNENWKYILVSGSRRCLKKEMNQERKDNKDIRWLQRLNSYTSALKQLNDAVDEYNKRELNSLEKQGLIKAFEFTFELSWNLIKDYFNYQGMVNIRGSRDSFREAFKYNLVEDGVSWMEMIELRNLSSHTYDEDTAEEIIELIAGKYIDNFNMLEKNMQALRNDIFRTK